MKRLGPLLFSAGLLVTPAAWAVAAGEAAPSFALPNAAGQDVELEKLRGSVVYDPAGKSPASWQVKAMPSSYLVDASGKVVLVETGFKDERKGEVEERIRAALGVR